MKNKKIVLIILATVLFATAIEMKQIKEKKIEQKVETIKTVETATESQQKQTFTKAVEEVTTEKETTVKTALETVKTEEPKTEPESIAQMYGFSAAEFELFQRVVFAEAGNQGFFGKQLVADVILNRLASEQFPDTLGEVLLQKNQFSCVSTGAIYCYDLDEESKQAIITELMLERQNKDIIFFRTESFSEYGTPAFQYGDHYFSTN